MAVNSRYSIAFANYSHPTDTKIVRIPHVEFVLEIGFSDLPIHMGSTNNLSSFFELEACRLLFRDNKRLLCKRSERWMGV